MLKNFLKSKNKTDNGCRLFCVGVGLCGSLCCLYLGVCVFVCGFVCVCDCGRCLCLRAWVMCMNDKCDNKISCSKMKYVAIWPNIGRYSAKSCVSCCCISWNGFPSNPRPYLCVEISPVHIDKLQAEDKKCSETFLVCQFIPWTSGEDFQIFLSTDNGDEPPYSSSSCDQVTWVEDWEYLYVLPLSHPEDQYFFSGSMKSRSGSRVGVSGSFLDKIS